MLSKAGLLLLGMIHEHPMGAYEITKMLDVMNVKWWFRIADATVYSTIRNLEKKSYITGNVEKNGRMPERTVYTITREGKEVLKEEIKVIFQTMDFDTTGLTIATNYLSIFEQKELESIIEARLNVLTEYEIGIQQNIREMEQKEISQIIIDNVVRMKNIVETEKLSALRMLKTIQERCSDEQ